MNKSYCVYAILLVVLLGTIPPRLQQDILALSVLGIIWREVGK